jgi:hypothetical protein
MDNSHDTRLNVLAACLIVLTIATAALLPTDLLIAAKWHEMLAGGYRPPVKPFNYDAQAKDDIPIGTDFPVTGLAAQVKKAAGKLNQGCLVVGLGDCAACIQFDLRDWEEEARKRGIPLVAFTLSDVKDIRSFEAQAHTHVSMVTDTGNALHKALNCYWAGRAYYYDNSWKLRWRMTGATSSYSLPGSPELLALIGGKR